MSDDDRLKTHVSVNVNALLVGKDEQLQLQFAPEEGVAEEMMNRQIEEKMLEIAQILGISVDGRIFELRVCIREMIAQEKRKGLPQGRGF